MLQVLLKDKEAYGVEIIKDNSGQFYWWRKLEYLEKTTDLP
jgi:hypothetical protein